ncbi:glycosyl hydrolase [Sulfurimonas sp.]
MKQPFEWDNYSDQPYQLKDRGFKKKMRKKELFSLFKTILIALIVIPFSLLAMPFVRRKKIISPTFFSLGVDFTREPQATQDMLDELEVEHILVRFKLWEMHTLKNLQTFLKNNSNKKITLKILQDAEHIKDSKLLEKDLNEVFTATHNEVALFEIGSTINRAKWGFFSVNQYLKFYKTAYTLKKKKFSNIKLIGSGVIDFEYHYSAHTLFNLCKCKYDGVSALLYVDRRGAPENTQMGFTLLDKIALLSTMIWLSPKTTQELHITETNWPLSGTKPYAPTSEHECVSHKEYANFMLRYYLLAFASQQVDSVSWHQLIAPGYGLVDSREGIQKREAYSTYMYMLHTLKNAQFLRLDIKRDYYILQCLVNNQLLQIHWSLKPTTLRNEDFFTVYDKNGQKVEHELLKIGASPLYIFIANAQ